MVVQAVEKYWKGNEQVKLNCQYSGTPEDNSFAKATPNGNLFLSIDNEALHGFFQPGDEFYVDLTKIDK
jgi:hypothetical protein